MPLALLEHLPVGVQRQRDRAVSDEVLDVIVPCASRNVAPVWSAA
jgi:hypothetical protein